MELPKPAIESDDSTHGYLGLTRESAQLRRLPQCTPGLAPVPWNHPIGGADALARRNSGIASGGIGLLNWKSWNSSQRVWCRYCGKLGEAFVEGHIKVDGPVDEVFRVATTFATSVSDTNRAGFHFFKPHSRSADRKAIEYHYDVSNDFYRLFLDPGMVYSCAYYCDEADTLEQAQVNKLDHILNKLMVKPGERLLDIGCGWGSLILRAAGKYGSIAHGITTIDADSRWMGLGAGEFIDRYVFPEGELPHISLVQREMALARLDVTDV